MCHRQFVRQHQVQSRGHVNARFLSEVVVHAGLCRSHVCCFVSGCFKCRLPGGAPEGGMEFTGAVSEALLPLVSSTPPSILQVLPILMISFKSSI